MNNPTLLLSGVRSDSHTWGLAFLTLWFEELGFRVINLGSCVPAAEIVAACNLHNPDLIVLSSVNGHGAQEGKEVLAALLEDGCAAHIPILLGGKLTTSLKTESIERQKLLAAGFAGVFTGSDSLIDCELFLRAYGLLVGEPAEDLVAA